MLNSYLHFCGCSSLFWCHGPSHGPILSPTSVPSRFRHGDPEECDLKGMNNHSIVLRKGKMSEACLLDRTQDPRGRTFCVLCATVFSVPTTVLGT